MRWATVSPSPWPGTQQLKHLSQKDCLHTAKTGARTFQDMYKIRDCTWSVVWLLPLPIVRRWSLIIYSIIGQVGCDAHPRIQKKNEGENCSGFLKSETPRDGSEGQNSEKVAVSALTKNIGQSCCCEGEGLPPTLFKPSNFQPRNPEVLRVGFQNE